MSTERHERLRKLFLAANNLSPDERDEFLARLRQEDEAFKRELRQLLTESDLNPDFLEAPAIDPALQARLHDEILARDDALLSAVGPYRLQRLIGEGTFARVYLAEQEDPIRRQVAIKVLRVGLDSKAVLRRFDAEQQALGRLNHPSVVRIFDSGRLDDGSARPYFVMEHVDGEPITDYANRLRLSLRQCTELLMKVCEAVQHAHVLGIIHRDLKPSNILVVTLDGQAIPKIIDFGVAKAIGDARLADYSFQTSQGDLLGTLAYMSPEQLRGETDTRSDVYALGVLAYELIAGQLPIDLRNVPLAEAARRIEESTPRLLARTNARVSRDLGIVVTKALAKNPQDRYQSVISFAEDLSRYLAHEPILARKPSVVRVLTSLVRRHRATSLVMLVCAAMVVSAAIFAFRKGMRASYAEEKWAARVEQITRSLLVELEIRPGTFENRKEVTTDAYEDARQLLARDPDNADLLDLSALATRHQSRIPFETGDYPNCAALREEAYRLRQAALAAEPSNAAIRQDLAIDMVLIGDVHWQMGDTASQRKWFDRSHELTQQLVAEQPSVQNRNRLAWSYHRLSGNDLHEGRFDCARENVNHSLRLVHDLLQEDSSNVSALECARLDYAYLGVLAQRAGDIAERKRSMQESLRLAERLVAIDASNRVYLVAHLHALFEHADFCTDRNEAHRLYESGYARSKHLLSVDPHHKDGLISTAIFAQRAAVGAARQGDPEKAREYLREAVELADRLPKDIPQDMLVFGEILQAAGRTHDELGDAESAPLLQQARESALALGRRTDALPDQLRACAERILDIGGATISREDARMALDFATRACASANTPISANWRMLGRAQLTLNDTSAALASFEQAIAIANDEGERQELFNQIASLRTGADTEQK